MNLREAGSVPAYKLAAAAEAAATSEIWPFASRVTPRRQEEEEEEEEDDDDEHWDERRNASRNGSSAAATRDV